MCLGWGPTDMSDKSKIEWTDELVMPDSVGEWYHIRHVDYRRLLIFAESWDAAEEMAQAHWECSRGEIKGWSHLGRRLPRLLEV